MIHIKSNVDVEPTDLEIFGAAVRSRRIQIDLSQEQLANLASLHRTYIGGVERGERNVSLKNILLLCRALRIRPSELMAEFDDFIEKGDV